MGDNPPPAPLLASLALHIDAKACRIIPAQNAPQPKEGGCIKHAKTKMRFASKGLTAIRGRSLQVDCGYPTGCLSRRSTSTPATCIQVAHLHLTSKLIRNIPTKKPVTFAIGKWARGQYIHMGYWLQPESNHWPTNASGQGAGGIKTGLATQPNQGAPAKWGKTTLQTPSAQGFARPRKRWPPPGKWIGRRKC